MSTEVKAGGISALSAVASEEALQQMRDEFAGLTADTKEGYEEVRKAIRVCVKTRSGIDAARKSLNEEALAWQRKVNAEAKRLTGEVEKIEAPLVDMKAAVDAETERKRKELEEKQRAFVNGRVSQYLAVAGEVCPVETAETLTETQWAEFLRIGGEKLEARKAEEAAKVEAERAAREKMEAELQAARAEAQALRAQAEKERAELEALRAEKLEAERRAAEEEAKIKAERERLEKLEEQRKTVEQLREMEAEFQAVLDGVRARKPKYMNDLESAVQSLVQFTDAGTTAIYGELIDEAMRSVNALKTAFEASMPAFTIHMGSLSE